MHCCTHVLCQYLGKIDLRSIKLARGELELADLDFLSESISTLYCGTDLDIEQLIIQTLARLPEEVQEFVCSGCRFLSIGRSANALVLSGSIALPFPLHSPEGIKWAIEQGRIEALLLNPPKLILLSEHIVDEYEQEDSLSIVAHEIAHAYLGHEPRHVRDEVNLPAEREVEACQLARQWGFSGRGTDAESRAAAFTDCFKLTTAK